MSDNAELLPIPPTVAVADPQARTVIETLAHNLQLTADQQLTESRARDIAQQAVVDLFGGGASLPGSGVTNAQIIDTLANSIMQSLLYQKLGEQLRVDLSDVLNRSNDGLAGLQQEVQMRQFRDLAMASAINKIWASVGGSAAVISDATLASATPAAAAATKWDSVVSAVTDPNTGAVNSASIVQELDTYANNANSTFNASYTVRAQIATGGTTYTGTAATPTATVNNAGNTVLTTTARTGTPTVGMYVYGPGVPGGTTITAVATSTVTLSAALNAAASTTADAYSFSSQTLVIGGFGLMASQGAGSAQAPTVDFGIRADKFYVASTASTPSLATQLASTDNSIPFIVTTTTQTIDGITYTPGVYIKKAIISDASVDTLKIAGNAVIVPAYNTSSSAVTITSLSTWYDIVSVVIDYGTAVTNAKGLIGFSLQHGSGGGGEWAIQWRVIRGDGTIIGSGEQSVSNNSIGNSTVTAVVYDNVAYSTARTYKLQVANYGNVGSARVVAAGAVIYGLGAKR